MSRHLASRAALTAGIAAAAVLASAVGASAATPNGEAKKSPKQILADSEKALLAVKSVRIVGNDNEDGMNFKISETYVKGVGSSGTITIGKGVFSIIEVGNYIYLKANAAFLKDDGYPTANANKWVQVQAKSVEGKDLAQFSDEKSFVSGVTSYDKKITKTAGTTKVSGKPAVALVDHSSDGGTLYIAATGAPLPLKEVAPTKSEGSLTFTYNVKASIKAPASFTIV